MAEVRVIPHDGPRVETGPVQFGDDWNGLFIRGDRAGWMAMRLKRLVQSIEAGEKPDWSALGAVREFLSAMDGVIVGPAASLIK